MSGDLQKYISKQLENPEFQKVLEESRLGHEVASQLIRLRKTTGLTQEELARLVDTRQSEISRIETGDQNISINKLNKIAGAMGAEVEIIIKPAP